MTTTTTTTTVTTTTPPPVTVASIVDGRTVLLSNGTRLQVLGLASPGECWAASSAEFATKTLVGQPIQALGTRLLLAGGQDYAVLAASQGVARAVAGADAAVQQAQTVAQQARRRSTPGSPAAGRHSTVTKTVSPANSSDLALSAATGRGAASVMGCLSWGRTGSGCSAT